MDEPSFPSATSSLSWNLGVIPKGAQMSDVPVEATLCFGSGGPSAAVDDVTLSRRLYLCEWCGASMEGVLTADHPALLQ